MTDKVQKIREEIEKLHKEYRRKEGAFHYRKALRAALFIIDSMQEPKFKAGDHIRPIDSCLGSPRTIVDVCDGWYVTDQGTLDFEYEDNWEAIEEPVSEEWIEELRTKLDSLSKEDLKKVFDKYAIDFNEEPVSRTPADIEAAMQEVEEKSRAFTEAHHGEDADTILAQMRGEEADEVVAKLEEVLNQKK